MMSGVMRMETPVLQVPHDRLLDHVQNAHMVNSRERNGLKNNIRRSGRYPPLIVHELRPTSKYWPGEPGFYQVLDGHQRKDILRELYEEGLAEFELVTVEDWGPLTDEEALLLLATLNTWGSNNPLKRAELLHSISKFTEERDAVAILPETSAELKSALALLKRPVDDVRRRIEEFDRDDLVEVSFVVGADQETMLARMLAAMQVLAGMYGADLINTQIERNKKSRRIAVCTFQVAVADKTLVENALAKAMEDHGHRGRNKRGKALVVMAQQYLATTCDDNQVARAAQIVGENTSDASQASPPQKESPATASSPTESVQE
jgi:hypothetical protein